ncbi:MAG: TPM domain-containing protein [Clostridia bacterium]
MKKAIAILLLAALALGCASGALAQDTARVYDRAELLTPAEERAISSEIAQFQADTNMDFVIVTSNEEHEDSSSQQIADAFYDQGGFGLDEEHSGILYYIDMQERYHYLSTRGAMIDYMTDARIEDAIEECTGELAKGDYLGAAMHMLSMVRNDIKQGIPEGQYRYDIVTGERLTARHKVLTGTEMLFCAIAALAVGLLFMAMISRTYKLKGSTYHYDYRENSSVAITGSDDTYLRTTTTQVRRPEPSGSGSGGGGGSGSGTHSSGGTSHGGGGGHF